MSDFEIVPEAVEFMVERALSDYDRQVAEEPDPECRCAMLAARPKVEALVRAKTIEQLTAIAEVVFPENGSGSIH